MGHVRFKVRTWLSHTFDIQQKDIHAGCFVGTVMFLISVAVRLLSGAPYRVYFLLREAGIFPPLIIFTLLTLLITCTMGFACGVTLLCRKKHLRESKYQAGMIAVLLSLCWFAAYPLIFRGAMLAFGLFCLGMAWFLSFCVIKLYFRIQILSAWLMIISLLWQTYQLIALLNFILWL